MEQKQICLIQENKKIMLEVINKKLKELKEIQSTEAVHEIAKTIQVLVETSLSM